MVDVHVGQRKLTVSVTGDGIRSVAEPPVVMHYRDMSVIGVVHGVGVMVCCTGQHPGWTVFWHDACGDFAAWAPLVAPGAQPVVRVDSPWAVVLARGDDEAFVAIDTQHRTMAACEASGRAAWCGAVADLEAVVVCRDSADSFGLLVCARDGHPRSVLAWPLHRRDLDRIRRAAAGAALALRYAGERSITVPPMGGRPQQGWHDWLTASQGVPLGVVMDVEAEHELDESESDVGEGA